MDRPNNMTKEMNIYTIIFIVALVAFTPVAMMGGLFVLPFIVAAVAFTGLFIGIPFLGIKKIYRNYHFTRLINRIQDSIHSLKLNELSDLEDGHLKGKDIRVTDFAGLEIRSADLSSSNLSLSDLSKVDLKSSDLKNARLEGSILSGANLSQANLQGANLKGAILNKVRAKGTNWRGAIFGKRTVLPFSKQEAISKKGMIYAA